MPIYYFSVALAHILGLSDNNEITTWFTYRTDRGWGVKQTNTDLPNTYRRSTTETIMHPIGQKILLMYPHFGIDFLQPPRFLNSEDSETVKLSVIYFPSKMVNVQYLQQEKYISSLPGRYPYCNDYLLHFISICIILKTLHSDELVRVVPNSCITHFNVKISEKEFRHSTLIL